MQISQQWQKANQVVPLEEVGDFLGEGREKGQGAQRHFWG